MAEVRQQWRIFVWYNKIMNYCGFGTYDYSKKNIPMVNLNGTETVIGYVTTTNPAVTFKIVL